MEIDGIKKFKIQVRKGLKLLEDKAPGAYKLVVKYIGKIEQGDCSRMFGNWDIPTFEVTCKTAFDSVEWLAAAFAHEAVHSRLYHAYKKTHIKDVPYEVWCGVEIELVCIKYQVKVLKQIGGKEVDIAHLKKQDGKHCLASQDRRTW